MSVEYQVASIDDYLSGGRPWSLDRNRGGFRRMVPQSGSGPATEDEFAHGNADLLLRMSRDLMHFGAEHARGGQRRPRLRGRPGAGHRAARRLGRRRHGDDRPRSPSARRARTSWSSPAADGQRDRRRGEAVAAELGRGRQRDLRLPDVVVARGALRAPARAERGGRQDPDDGDGGADSGLGDFGEHLLPRLISGGTVRTEPLAGYWRDLGRPGAYLNGHRDLIAGKVDVFDHDGYPVISHWDDRPTARLRSGCHVEDSLVSPGVDVSGEVVRSVLGPGVVVEKGARVEDSVIFADCRVEAARA